MTQLSLFSDEDLAPVPTGRDEAITALDDLCNLAGKYKSSESYRTLLDFIARFPAYAPFNAALLHIQMPGAQYVAAPGLWKQYGRRIKPGARPLLILRQGGPVMFLFDVSDTTTDEGAPALPPGFERPFEVLKGNVGKELDHTIESAKLDSSLPTLILLHEVYCKEL